MRSILSKNLSKYEIIDLCSRYYSVAIFYAIAAIATFVQLIALIGLIYFNYSFHLHRFLYHTHWIFSLHFLTMPQIGERLELKKQQSVPVESPMKSPNMRLYKGQLQKFIKMQFVYENVPGRFGSHKTVYTLEIEESFCFKHLPSDIFRLDC